MSLSLDDLWLKQLGLWNDANPTRSRRLYRVLVVGAIGVSSLIDTLLLGLFWSTGTVDARVPLLYGCAAAGHVLLFSALHWSGFSERFRNTHSSGRSVRALRGRGIHPVAAGDAAR